MNTRIYISCFTSDLEIMRIKWGLKKTGGVLDADQQYRFDHQSGGILTYSWLEDKVVSEIVQGCPFGMHTYDGKLFVCDAKFNSVVVYNATTLEKLQTIHSKMFNDVHSVTPYGDSLIITSTGTDAVLALSLKDYSVHPLVSFTASDGPLGVKAQPGWSLDQLEDYSRLHINTETQLTHLNYAAPLSDGRIAISLFHQGVLVAYDVHTQSCDVIVDDLFRSHAFFEYEDNLFVADSGNHCVKIFNCQTFELKQVIKQDGWVQDIKHVVIDGQDLMFVADADHSNIDVYALKTLECIRTIHVADKYRLSSIELVVS